MLLLTKNVVLRPEMVYFDKCIVLDGIDTTYTNTISECNICCKIHHFLCNTSSGHDLAYL